VSSEERVRVPTPPPPVGEAAPPPTALIVMWLVGLALTTFGVLLIYRPAAFVVAGSALMAWSTWRLSR
jgi:hypothetical protein